MEKFFLAAVLVITVVQRMRFGPVWRMQRRSGKTTADIRTLRCRSLVANESALVHFNKLLCQICKSTSPNA